MGDPGREKGMLKMDGSTFKINQNLWVNLLREKKGSPSRKGGGGFE